MGVYKNNKNGTLDPIATNLQVVNAPMEQFITEAEFSAVTPNDISTDNKLVAENEVTKAVDTMPTASAGLVGTIVQYVGETTANYTNGYFYKCVSDGEATPTYSWVNVAFGNTEDINELINEDYELVTPTWVTKEYVSYSGNIETVTGAQWARTNAIQVTKGTRIKFKATGYVDNVAMISECDSDGSNIVPVIISEINPEGGNTYYKDYTYTMTHDGYVMLSCSNYGSSSKPTEVYFHSLNKIEALDERVNAVEVNNVNRDNSLYKIFQKVVCVGDSYTKGYMASDTESLVDKPEYSWVSQMGDVDHEWINCGVSGATSRSWLTNANGLDKAQGIGEVQAYIIGLGINDSNNSSVPVGEPTDIGTNNDTYYGKMSKIISELATVSPDAIFFVNTCPFAQHGATGRLDPYNVAIRTMVAQLKSTYKIHCIDLVNDYADLYYDPNHLKNYKAAHPTALGHAQIAQMYKFTLSDYISKHIHDFMNVPWINFDEGASSLSNLQSALISPLSTGNLDFEVEWESGFLSDTGVPSASVNWSRTGFFEVPNDVTLHATRILTSTTAGNDFRFLTFASDGTFESIEKHTASYNENEYKFDLIAGKKYRMVSNWPTPYTIYTKWDMEYNTPLTTLIKNQSSTVTRIDSMTAAEFNSRDANDDAMTNGAQYNIYGAPIFMFHNGKTASLLGSRDYLAKFALLSDAHIGGATYDQTKKAQYLASLANINTLGVDFAVELGDNVDNGYSYTDPSIFNEQTNEHKTIYRNLDAPLFSFGGNHDTGVANYSKYGTIDFNGVRLIKFHADYCSIDTPEGQSGNNWSTGIVPTNQLEYIDEQLDSSKAKVDIVMCHYPIAIDNTYQDFRWWIKDSFTDKSGTERDGHRDDLLQILNDHNVKLYLSGHEHKLKYYNFGDVGNIHNFNSPTFQNVYTIITVKETEVIFQSYDITDQTAHDPYTLSLV